MKKLLLLSLIILGFGFQAKASHMMGADISYQYLYSDATNDYYQVTLTVYRDCSGTSVGASMTLRMNSGSGCGTAFTQSLPLVGTATEVSPLCPSQLANSTCNGGTIVGVEQYIFQDIVAFPTKCDDWNLNWYLCCRNDGGAGPPPHNLVTPASWDLYVEAELDNTGTLNNNSPQFTSLPVPYICANQPFTYNHGAFDPDGDSLVYTMIPAQDGPYPGVNLAYAAPATATNPIVGSTNIFDSQTGSIWVNPDGSDELAVMAVLVEEYRNGVLIGTTMRDLQVVVQSCSNVQPQDGGPNGGFDVVTGDGAIVDSNSIEVCPNGYVEFEVVYEDPNAADDITLLTNIATVIPGATFTQSGTNPATGVFTWTPTAADVGFHNFTITVQDDGCPILGSQVFAFDIDVLTRTFTEPDQAYCASSGPLDITASGGSVFTWTTLSGDGLGCMSCATTTGAPTTTATYEVTSDLSGTCKNKDTITITRVPDITLTPSSDPTICKYGSAGISVTASPGAESPFTYSWTGDSLSDNTISGPTANPLVTTTYDVLVTSAAGCRMTTSITVNVSGVAPNVNVNAAADSLCQGESANLTSVVMPDICEVTSVACSGANQSLELGTATTSSSTYGPFYHSASGYSNRKQYMIRASELYALGFTSGGRINGLDLNINIAGGMAGAMSGMQVSMGCTDMDQFPNTSFQTGLAVVRNAANFTPNAGWNTVSFDNPYMWDGVSNLIIEFCTDDTHNGTASTVYYTSTTSTFYSVIYSNFLGAGACSDAAGSRTYYRPNMRLDVCEAIPGSITYSWSPSGGSSASATVSPGSSTTYTLTASDGACDGTSAVPINVSPAINTTTSADNSICYGDNINISVSPSGSSGYTYNWFPSATLSSTSMATSTATPTGSTTYYVDVNAGFCTVRDSVVIGVGGGPMSAYTDKDTICPNETAQLTAAVGGGCFNEYQTITTTTTPSIGVTNTFDFTSAPSGSFSGGTLTVCAFGDIDLSSEYWIINDENGTLIGNVADIGSQTQCGVAYCLSFALTDADINNWAADGTISFEAVASASNNVPYCADSVYMKLEYCTPSGTYNYVWDNGGTLSNTTIDNPTATPSQTTTYNVTATDPGAPTCPSNASITVAIDSTVYVDAAADRTLACNGEAVSLSSAVTGSPLPGSYSACGANGSTCGNGTFAAQLGTGASNSYTYGPFYASATYTDSRIQYIITAAEMTTAGFSSGAIGQLRFNIPTTNNYTGTLNNVQVKMGCTTVDEYPSTGYAYLATSATVWSGTLDLTGVTGWYVMNLTNRFDWDGTSNIVLEFCFNNNSAVSYAYFQYGSTTSYRTLRQYATTGATCNLSSTIYRNNYRPNIRFTMCAPPPVSFTYSWTPTTGLSSSTAANPNFTSDGSGHTYTVTVSGGRCDVIDTVNVDACILANDNINLLAKQQGQINVLDWESSIENVSTYVVERSINGESFESIGEQKSSGANFTFNDMNPGKGTNQYRIRCIMEDMDDQYSNTAIVEYISDNVSVYPNPTNSASTVFITFESEASKIDIELVDLLGQKMKAISTPLSGSQNKVELDVSDLAVGTYMYKVNIDGRTTIGKLVLSN